MSIGTGPERLMELAAALEGTDVQAEGAVVRFNVADAAVVANVKDGASRLRIRARLDTSNSPDPEAWFAKQRQPFSGTLEEDDGSDQRIGIRLVFERPLLGNDWAADPLGSDIRTYATALAEGADVVKDPNAGTYEVLGDPRDEDPASAWLVIGDQASYPGAKEHTWHQLDGDVGVFNNDWTAAKQTQAGDLVLVYFMAPDKAVHFVARAASDAFFDRDTEVNTNGRVASEQRWIYLTPLIKIEPIQFATLQAACSDHLILKGRSGKYLRPEVIEALTFKPSDPNDQAELDRIVSTPIGRADLPDPADMDLDQWRAIAAGALPLEAHVESHIVEPLLTLMGFASVDWERQHRLASGVVDYIVKRDGRPVAAIEVKLATPRPPSGDWSTTAEFQQLRRYVDEMQVPGLLVDAHRILLVEPLAKAATYELQRAVATDQDIRGLVKLFASR